MRPWLKTLVACSTVVVFGAAGLWAATDGGRALTAEGARRLRALEAPELVPDVILTDRHGETARLRRGDGSVTLVEFIYTTCPTLCQSAGAAFLQLQERLRAHGLAAHVQLLSVTFDLERDGPGELAAYEQWHHADGRQWRVVRPAPHELAPLLKAFAVVVLPDPLVGFQHNAAIHVVDDSGRLVGIFDLEDVDNAVQRVAAILDRGRT
jgi:protein SCO1